MAGNTPSTPGIDRGDTFGQIIAPGTVPKITSIFDVSAEFLGQLRLWLEQNPPSIAITSILGFAQFTAQLARVVTGSSETTGSSVYGDLATVGPTLSGLPNGQYVMLYAAQAMTDTLGHSAIVNVSFNGQAPAANDLASVGTTAGSYAVGFTTVSLKNGNNTAQLKYANDSTGSSIASFNRRALLAIKFANT